MTKHLYQIVCTYRAKWKLLRSINAHFSFSFLSARLWPSWPQAYICLGSRVEEHIGMGDSAYSSVNGREKWDSVGPLTQKRIKEIIPIHFTSHSLLPFNIERSILDNSTHIVLLGRVDVIWEQDLLLEKPDSSSPWALWRGLERAVGAQESLCMPRFLPPLALSQVRKEKSQGPKNGSVNQDLIRTLKISLHEFSDLSIWTWEATVPIIPERKDPGRLPGIPHGRMLS